MMRLVIVKSYFFVERFFVTVQDDDVLEVSKNLHLLFPHQHFRNQTCTTETRNTGYTIVN